MGVRDCELVRSTSSLKKHGACEHLKKCDRENHFAEGLGESSCLTRDELVFDSADSGQQQQLGAQELVELPDHQIAVQSSTSSSIGEGSGSSSGWSWQSSFSSRGDDKKIISGSESFPVHPDDDDLSLSCDTLCASSKLLNSLSDDSRHTILELQRQQHKPLRLQDSVPNWQKFGPSVMQADSQEIFPLRSASLPAPDESFFNHRQDQLSQLLSYNQQQQQFLFSDVQNPLQNHYYSSASNLGTAAGNQINNEKSHLQLLLGSLSSSGAASNAGFNITTSRSPSRSRQAQAQVQVGNCSIPLQWPSNIWSVPHAEAPGIVDNDRKLLASKPDFQGINAGKAQSLPTINLPGQMSRKSGKKVSEEGSRRCPPQETNRDCKRLKGTSHATQKTRVGSSSKRSQKREPALNTNLKPRAKQGCANDPQSLAARQRRERISDRLKILQELIPNGSKVDLVTMLEKAINYVKFLQLQVKVLMNDEYWPKRDEELITNLESDV